MYLTLLLYFLYVTFNIAYNFRTKAQTLCKLMRTHWCATVWHILQNSVGWSPSEVAASANGTETIPMVEALAKGAVIQMKKEHECEGKKSALRSFAAQWLPAVLLRNDLAVRSDTFLSFFGCTRSKMWPANVKQLRSWGLVLPVVLRGTSASAPSTDIHGCWRHPNQSGQDSEKWSDIQWCITTFFQNVGWNGHRLKCLHNPKVLLPLL